MNTLTHYQQRGHLTYWTGETFRTETGWFWLSLDGRTVIRRKIGGRNCYQFASVHSLYEFLQDDKAK